MTYFIHWFRSYVQYSYFEWVQNLQQLQWDESEVNEKLEKKMVSAFEEVSILMEQRKTSMRMAAFAVAIDRVAQAYALRGI